MTQQSTETLIEGLNNTCRKAMEDAALLCVSRTHSSVDLAHFLLKLIDPPNTDIQRIMRWFGVDTAKTIRQLTDTLATLPTGFKGTPSLSPHIIDALRGASMLTTRFTGDIEIRSSNILLALVGHDPLRTELLLNAHEFARIPPTALAHELSRVTAGSCEDTRAPSPPPSHSAGTAPTEGSALQLYTHDLSFMAAEGRLDPVIGRDKEIGQIANVLMRRRQNNPILVGPPGVGKTAIVEGLALKIHEGEVPNPLKHVRIRILDLGLLQAGAGIRGEFEKRVAQIIGEVKAASEPTVLFIDEAHMLVGSASAGGRNDAANLFKPALARGELRTIAATTWAEYKKHFEKDAALTRRFQPVKIHEPDDEVAIEMLRALSGRFEAHHKVHIEDEALQAAVSLSRRYIPSRFLPDKAIGALDTACADVAMRPVEPGVESGPICDAQAIAKVISDWTGIPVGRMLQDEIALVMDLQAQLARRLVGQRRALDTISRRIQTSRAGLDDPAKPVGVFLLVGPSGVGKTETALALSELLYGGERNLITINMSEYQEAHSVSLLRGAPPGYVGYGQGGVLTEAVRRRPYSVVLLDEIEKAHKDVLEVFYQVFDKGTLEDGEGVSVDFSNTVMLLTSNIGAHTIEAEHGAEPGEALWRQLTQALPIAFLGRLVVVPYTPLSMAHLKGIAQLKLDRIKARFETQHTAALSFEEDTAASIARRCTASGTGARDIDRLLTHHMLPAIAEIVLAQAVRGEPVADMRVGLDADGLFKCL